MDTEKLQVHLASKIDIPETPAVLEADGKTVKTPKVPARTVKVVGMSNRVVRFRVLDPDEAAKVALEAAQMAGDEATGRELFMKTRAFQAYTMVTEYSVPTDDPATLKEKDWTKATFADFITPGSPKNWKAIFTTKDTAFLQSEYTKWHELPADVVEMLSGKVLPVATGA